MSGCNNPQCTAVIVAGHFYKDGGAITQVSGASQLALASQQTGTEVSSCHPFDVVHLIKYIYFAALKLRVISNYYYYYYNRCKNVVLSELAPVLSWSW